MYKNYLYLAFVSIFLISGCSSLYMPNVPNTPMLSQTGELSASAHISLKGNTSINTAYAISDHFGVMANGSVMSQSRIKKDFNHNLVEAGIGYFTTFGPENKRIFELYTGIGKGSSTRIYKDDAPTGEIVNTEVQQSRIGKFFIQANYSAKKAGTLNLFKARIPLNYGTALRLSYVNMNKFTINNLDQPKEDNIFLEPVFFTRMAINKNVQLQYTSGSNIGLKSRKFLTAGNSVFTLGLVINVGGLFQNN